ncbi:PilZ domain-containing protein [Pseudorhodobacter turbinis]|nr:PilZ domain-containing protein [Pseudorhodobacter turbinis]
MPYAAIETLIGLDMDLSAYLANSPSTELSKVERSLAQKIKRWAHPDGLQGLDADAFGSTMYWSLSIIQGDLTLLEGALDCNSTTSTSSNAETARRGDNQSSLSEDRLRSFDKLTVSGVYLALFLFILIVAIIIFYPRKEKRKTIRMICNIPLHVKYEKHCTITRIVDLSQGGMKIKATDKDVDETWAQYNFAGIKLEGKTVWRNKAYAGIQFRKHISPETIDKVMKRNNQPISESDVGQTAPACFHAGCHKNCSLHLPTTTSLKELQPGQKEQ